MLSRINTLLITWVFASLLIAFCLSFQPLAMAGTWRDDFEDGDFNGWKMHTLDWQAGFIPDQGNWKVENGVVVGGKAGVRTWYTLFVDGGQSWSDYTAEVSVKISNPPLLPLHAGVFLYVYAPVESRFSGLAIRQRRGIIAEGFTYQIGRFDTLGFGTQPFEMKADRWYRLKITVEGKHIQSFIDGQPIAQFQGDRKGAPSFGVYKCVAMFDDFVVTGPDIPDGGPGAKAVSPKGKLATMWVGLKR